MFPPLSSESSTLPETPFWQSLRPTSKITIQGPPLLLQPIAVLLDHARPWSNNNAGLLPVLRIWTLANRPAACHPCKTGSDFSIRSVSTNVGKAQWSHPGKIKANSLRLVQGGCQGTCHLSNASFSSSAHHSITFYSK